MSKLPYRYFTVMLITIASLLVFTEVGFCVTSSATYDAIVFFNSGSGLLTSQEYGMSGVIGQTLSDYTEKPQETDAYFGSIAALSYSYEFKIDEYEVYDIQAFSFLNRQEVLEKTWQKNNDLYFTWKILPSAPASLIMGYSVALNEDPNYEIDTTVTYYDGFVNTFMAEGRHAFYVKVATTGLVWGDTSSFEFWVDTRGPVATDLTPAPGSLLTDNSPEISVNLSDVHSGLDIESIKLFIDNGLISSTYEEGVVSASPLGLSDGSKTVRIQAEDMAGNLLNQVWGFVIDAGAPSGSILINGGEDSTNFARVRLNLEAWDETSQVTQMVLSNDGMFDIESWENFTSIRTDWVLDEPQKVGLKTVYCMFKDEAGNVSAVYEDSILLLAAAIDTTITSGPYGPTQEIGAEFNYQSTFQDVVFSYKLDDQDWSFWSKDTSVSFSDLSFGNHVFSVKSAGDANGDFIITEDEEDPIPAQWTWVIQTEGEEPEEEERVLYWRTE